MSLLVATPLGLVLHTRRRRDGLLECALLTDGGFPGLPQGKWRHGAAVARPGVLRFRPGDPVGMRFPRGTPFGIPVLSARVEDGRHPPLRQAWSINPTLQIARLHTPHGDLSLAAPALTLPGLLDDLRTPPDAT